MILAPPFPILAGQNGVRVSMVINDSHATHAGIGDDEFDCDGSRARDRCDVERFVVDPSHDKAECLHLSSSVGLAIRDEHRAHLSDRVEGARNSQNTFWVTVDYFGDGDSRT